MCCQFVIALAFFSTSNDEFMRRGRHIQAVGERNVTMASHAAGIWCAVQERARFSALHAAL